MSHNVSIKGISINDFEVLKTALSELNDEYGTKFRLEEGSKATTRLWRRDTALPNTVAVIKCDHLGYDIALTRENGHISMTTEALNISRLQADFGVNRKVIDITDDREIDLSKTGYMANEQLGMQGALGPIMQRYGVCLMEQEAVMQGKTTSRQYDQDTGVMNVVVTY